MVLIDLSKKLEKEIGWVLEYRPLGRLMTQEDE